MDNKDLEKIWAQYKKIKDTETKKKLLDHYFLYVQRIASNMAKTLKFKVPAEELASHGVEGLNNAIEAYDDSRGTKFETYAYIRIRGSIIDGLRRDDDIPRSVRQRWEKIDKIKSSMEMKEGSADISDVLKKAKFSKQDYYKNLKKYNPMVNVSLEDCHSRKIKRDEANDISEYLVDKSVNEPYESMVKSEIINKIISEFLNEEEKQVIFLRYYQSLTFREIAEKLNIKNGRVSFIHKNAIKKLKEAVSENKEYFDDSVLQIFSK